MDTASHPIPVFASAGQGLAKSPSSIASGVCGISDTNLSEYDAAACRSAAASLVDDEAAAKLDKVHGTPSSVSLTADEHKRNSIDEEFSLQQQRLAKAYRWSTESGPCGGSTRLALPAFCKAVLHQDAPTDAVLAACSQIVTPIAGISLLNEDQGKQLCLALHATQLASATGHLEMALDERGEVGSIYTV